MEWSVELSVALIGAITGISSLLLQFFDYWKNRPKLEVNLNRDSPSFYFFNDGSTFTTPDSLKNVEIVAPLSILIRNKSAQAITIEKIEVFHKSAQFPLRLEKEIMRNRVEVRLEGNRYRVYNFGNSLNFPYRIDGYDSLLGNIKVAWIKKDFLDSENKLNLTINLITAKNKITKEITLEKFKK